MKKRLLPLLILSLILLCGCNLNLSNLDVQKLNTKATEYMQSGEYDKAASRLEAIIELNPDLPETHYNLGIAYYNMQEFEKSIKALSNALIRNPEFADAYYSLGVVYEDYAYYIMNSDENDEKTKEIVDKKAAVQEYLENAKSNFESYLKFKKDAEDKKEVEDKIKQIEEKLTETEGVKE